MSSGGLIGSLLLALVGGAWIFWPLLRRRSAESADEKAQKQVERLQMLYERVLGNIRDLDEDHATGKMPTADYETEREQWVQRGIQVLQSLDQVKPAQVQRPLADDLDLEIEAAIAARRRTT